MNSVPAAFVQDVVRRSSKQDSAALSSFKEDTLWKSLSARLKHYEVGVSIDENGELRCIVYPVPSINSKSLSLDSFKATNPETHVIESFNICRPFWVSDKWARLPMDQMEAFYKFDLDRMSVQSTAGLYDSRVGSHNTALFEKFYQIFPSNFPFANLSLNYAGVQSEEFLKDQTTHNRFLENVELSGPWPQTTEIQVVKLLFLSKLKKLVAKDSVRVSFEVIEEFIEHWRSSDASNRVCIVVSVKNVNEDKSSHNRCSILHKNGIFRPYLSLAIYDYDSIHRNGTVVLNYHA